MECYSNVKGTQWTHCSGARGFRTCFTKYDTGEFAKRNLRETKFEHAYLDKILNFDYSMNLAVSDGAVTARGCSTKDKIFHIECENHVMGRTIRTTESFCYCSYSLCNSGSGKLFAMHFLVLTLISLIMYF